MVELPVEVVVVPAVADVEVEGRATLLDVDGWVAGGLVQLDSTVAASAIKSTLEDQDRFRRDPATAACLVLVRRARRSAAYADVGGRAGATLGAASPQGSGRRDRSETRAACPRKARAAGFSEELIHKLLHTNPWNAYSR